jgi:hypothetical protein
MDLLQATVFMADQVNGAAFLVGLIASVAIYGECKKCIYEIEREELLDSFLKEDSPSHS